MRDMAVALLTGSNLFILGQNGQAKSAAVRLFADCLKDSRFFAYQFNNETDEEKLFGRLDMSSLIPGGVASDVLESDQAYVQMLSLIHIWIPGTLVGDRNAFKHIATIPQYLNTSGTQIAEKIKSRFTPLFDPAAESLSKEIRQVDTCIWSHTGYHLYDAQMAVAEAVKRKIERNRPAIIVAE